MIKAVFLDRDGVINNNEANYYITTPEDLILNPGIVDALKIFRDSGFHLIVVSNQSGIAKEIYSREDCDRIHESLKKQLAENHIVLEEIYYCPHHPDTGNCLCRKPDSLLLEKAMARFNIDPAQSWMIGDSERDMLAAEKAGLKSILIKSNEDIRKYTDRILKKS